MHLLRSGVWPAPGGPGKAFKSVDNICEGLSGPPGPAKPQKRTPKIRPHCLLVTLNKQGVSKQSMPVCRRRFRRCFWILGSGHFVGVKAFVRQPQIGQTHRSQCSEPNCLTSLVYGSYCKVSIQSKAKRETLSVFLQAVLRKGLLVLHERKQCNALEYWTSHGAVVWIVLPLGCHNE